MLQVFIILVAVVCIVAIRRRYDLRKLLLIFYSLAGLAILTLVYVLVANQDATSLLRTNNNVNDLTQGMIGGCYVVDFGLAIAIARQFFTRWKAISVAQRFLSILSFVVVMGVLVYLIVLTTLAIREWQF